MSLVELYPYFILAVAYLSGLLAGVWAWRAGGRWREFSLPIAYLGSALPWLREGFDLAGLQGLLGGWAITLLLCGPLILPASMLAAVKCQRAATWGVTSVAAQFLVVAIAVGDWPYALLTSAGIGYFWLWDHLCRAGGWVEARAEPWLQAHVAVSVSAMAVIAGLYPAYVVHILRSGPADWREIGLQAAQAFPFQTMPVEAFLFGVFGVYAIAFTIAVALQTGRERLVVLTAPAPLGVWCMLAFLLPSDAADFVTVGIGFAALSAIVTWVMTVVDAAPVTIRA